MVTCTYPIGSGHHEMNIPSPTDSWPSLHMWICCGVACRSMSPSIIVASIRGSCIVCLRWSAVVCERDKGDSSDGTNSGANWSIVSLVLAARSRILPKTSQTPSAAFTLRTMILDTFTLSAAKLNSWVLAWSLLGPCHCLQKA